MSVLTFVYGTFGFLVIIVSAFALVRSTNAKTVMEIQEKEIKALSQRLSTEEKLRGESDVKLAEANGKIRLLEEIVTGKEALERLERLTQEHYKHLAQGVGEIRTEIEEVRKVLSP